MWLFAMFDLPVDTPAARRSYTRFRTSLLSEGFLMLQYSVYARYFASDEASAAKRKRIKEMLPPHGEVRLMGVTDHQFGKMEVFHGKKSSGPEAPPEQMAFF